MGSCMKGPLSHFWFIRGFYVIMTDKINCDDHNALLLDIKCFAFFFLSKIRESNPPKPLKMLPSEAGKLDL